MNHLALVLVAFLAVSFAEEDAPFVTTALGKVKGSFKTSPNGKTYSAFEGIPYAKPPIEDLRFKNPVPTESWQGTWDATKLYTCIQLNTFDRQNPGVHGAEDCLYLNVYVPNAKPSSNDDKLLDVIVHIHGGAFAIGSGHFFTTEQYLMDRNVIFVSLNYRLGVFGFLSTDDEHSSGNFGLKDQSLALAWIKEHISKFGGNPEAITITGLSAGSVSVHFHYLSPWSKGLFQRGIAQSGTALNPFSIQRNPLDSAKQIADWIGCPSEKSDEIVACLRTRPATQLLDKQNYMKTATNLSSLVPFGPVVEKSEKPFISRDPYAILVEGKLSNDVPLIISTAKDEGMPFSLSKLGPKHESNLWLIQAQNLDAIWSTEGPALLYLNRTLPKDEQIAAAIKVKDHYFGKNAKISLETLPQLTKLLSDRFFLNDCETAARTHAKVSKSPVYYYSFNYQSEVNILKTFGLDVEINAVPHGSDSPYVFTPTLAEKMLNLTVFPAADVKLSSIFLDFFTSFAKSGVPQIENVDWKPVTESELNVLQINGPDDLKVETVEHLADRAFWDSLNIQENQNIYNKA